MRIELALAIGGISLLSMAGCAGEAQVIPINTAAEKLGSPVIKYERTGDAGPVTATMPDGEVLTGRYTVARQGGFTFGSAWGAGVLTTGTATTLGGGQVQMILKGPRTQMLCIGSIGFSGHGNGQCRTIKGAAWDVTY